ncbi:alpha/beta fold hydrolase [Jhaorihella thermophila]|uniref:Lysophospholipase n=1 Tax=Jhaorihella thermophila TaxID=488547 RepID=A0A1H5RP31_9RHOB|nr:alpha/beta hydrolase [Jhaorihella thermophila]SEF40065.1 lysophospholipase [Jhaorihella thermophila]
MPLQPAPLFEDVAGGPPGGTAVWADTADGVRIRVGIWQPRGATRGTVLLFPGRTEYIEKYGQAAREMAGRGFATLAIDWRGQGLAQRLLDDPHIGHVERFADYQKDVSAALRAAREMDLPRPFHLLAHSMGGAIGLRAVMEGLPVQSCAFTGPMWGIRLSPPIRAFAWTLSHLAPMLGMGHRLAPGSTRRNYVEANPFEDNQLTTDPAMFLMMQEQLAAHPELGIGGPSLQWLREALAECRNLARRPSPDLPCVTFVGGNERIVDVDEIRRRMAAWPRGELDVIEGAEHEVLMETPARRTRIFDRLGQLYSAAHKDAAAS